MFSNRWKASTYSVSEKKAKSNFAYQYKKKNNKKDDEETAEADDSIMFLTKAFFFSPEQVEKVEVSNEDK